MKSFFSYLKNVRAELEHVVWPKPRTAIGHTVLILLLSIFAGLFLALMDYLFTSGVKMLIQ